MRVWHWPNDVWATLQVLQWHLPEAPRSPIALMAERHKVIGESPQIGRNFATSAASANQLWLPLTSFFRICLKASPHFEMRRTQWRPPTCFANMATVWPSTGRVLGLFSFWSKRETW